MAEMEDKEGEIITTYSIKVRGYLTTSVAHGLAIPANHSRNCTLTAHCKSCYAPALPPVLWWML